MAINASPQEMKRASASVPRATPAGAVVDRRKIDAEAQRGASPGAELPNVISVNGKKGAVILTAEDVGALPAGTVLPSGGVTSVNGKTGEVNLNAGDVGALPDTTAIPSKVSDLVNDSGFVNAAGAAAAAPVKSVNGQAGAVTLAIPDSTSGLVNDSGFVDAAGAAAAAPVQSINGQTGAVTLDAGDVGALPDTTVIPGSTSDLINDSGFVNAAEAAVAAPVQSINGQTGAVTLDADDVGAFADDAVIPVANGGTGADNAADARDNLGLGTSEDINAIAFQQGEAIPSGADLNAYTTPGAYCSPSGTITATLSNCPITGWNFRLDVRLTSGAGYLTQTLTSSGYADVYVRACHGGTWTSWAKLMTSNEVGVYLSTEPDAVSVGSGATVQLASVTLTSGVWVVSAGARFATNANGYRRVYFMRGSNTSSWIAENQSTPAVSGTYTYVNLCCVASVSVDTEYKLYVYQNSGSSLSTTARIYAVRIK